MKVKLTILIHILSCVTLLANARQTDAPPKQTHHFTVQECVDYALKNNVQVKNALIDIKIQNETNRGVAAAAYPQINGSVGATYFPNITVQSFPNFIAAATYGVLENEGVQNGSGDPIKSPADFGFIQAAFGTSWNATVGATLTQVLFDGQLFVGLLARKTTMELQQKNVAVTESLIKKNIYKLYYQLSASKTQLQQLDANINRLEILKFNSGELYKNGFVEKMDVSRASVQLTNLSTQKTTVENTINNGYLGLKLLMGMPAKDSLYLTENISEEKVKEGLLDEGIYSYTSRTDYNYIKVAEQLGEFNIRRYKLSRIPTASLAAAYNKMAQRNQFDFLGKGPWFTSSYIGLNIRVPIFSGFATEAAINKATLELEKTRNQVKNLEISIDNQVQVALNNYYNAVKTLDIQLQNIQLAEEVYQQTKTKYEIGTGSTLDITNAQTDLTIAQTNYINALYNALIAKVDYMDATGTL